MSETSPSLTPEQREVLTVIEDDLESYLSRDQSKWAQNWVADDTFHSIMECGTLQIADGFEAFQSNMLQAMEAEPAEINADVRRENLSIHIRGNLAWAIFDQIVADTENPLAPPNLSNNFRLLQKDDDRWRIVFHGVWSQPSRDAKSPTVEVTQQCDVVWFNQAAADQIKGFDGLTISQGRLRASKPAWDQQLRGQVERAYELTSFAKFNLAASDGGRAVKFPVVLGEDPNGALLLCWVKVADGRVFVLFGESPDLNGQIEIVQHIYGLSSSQTQTVRLLSKGLDLQDVADELGITVNTAKTHLKRAFEKVGVSSQLELMLKLVSFSV